jgi:hypothetical protein
MSNLKSNLTCSYCSKLYKDPIELPCSHNLCKGHLTEKSVVKQNRIKCVECKQEFEVKDNEFESNDFVKKQLDDHDYLSDEEFALKKQIEDSIRQFFQLYEQFTLNKTKLDLDVFEHFQEIRFQLDEHREELKQKIDDIYMPMIEKTKKFEATYLKSLEDQLYASLKSFETTSLEQSLKETEESFRNPDLMIESIREMQRQQEETIAELKLKLNEQCKVKDILTEMNEFKPNEKFQRDSFGQLYLKEYSSHTLKSQILSGNQPFDLIKVCEFSLKDKWTLLYRGTRDGFGAANFHSKCDGNSNTLTILKAHETSFIFGGFASVSWENSIKSKSDPGAFLFSLTNNENKPCKIRQINNDGLIYCSPNGGPTFGFGADLHICEFANIKKRSYSKLGHSYEHPQPNQGNSYLAGSPQFILSEIEVYQKE